jgi:ribonuclease HI
MTLQFTSLDDIWKLCDLNWAPQSKVTLIAAIINLINTIWFVRNQARFNDKIISWRSAISSIITSTSLTGNNTCKSSSNSIRDFIFLKKFNICINQPKIPSLGEILWPPPLQNWLKCNIDGASIGNPGVASCGGVFRDANGDFLYAFAEPLGFENAYFAELCGAMNAIEIAYHKKWLNLWLESDSSLVVAAFKNPSKYVPWPLRNRWKNVQVLVRSFNFVVSHICREGNKVADLFANQGLSLPSFSCWVDPPSFSLDCLLKNKLGFPNFRLYSP